VIIIQKLSVSIYQYVDTLIKVYVLFYADPFGQRFSPIVIQLSGLHYISGVIQLIWHR